MINLNARISPDDREVQLELWADDSGNEPFSFRTDAAGLLAFIESLIQIREQMKPSIAEAERAKGH